MDAICTNQSHHVALMRQIYNLAALVISWLGKDDFYTATEFQFIGKIIKKHASAGESLHASPDAIWSKQTMDALNLPHFPSHEWEALSRLFERAYLRGIWVLQEFGSFVKCCGQVRLPNNQLGVCRTHRSVTPSYWLGKSLEANIPLKCDPILCADYLQLQSELQW